MDPSALIFVALAVAWGVYLVPKALEHNDRSLRQRAANAGSSTRRVLARREKRQPLVTADGVRHIDVPVELTLEQRLARRDASRRATRRRRNVLSLIVLALVTVSTVAAFAVIDWVWVAIPAGVMTAWLLTCRLMVRKEHDIPMQRVRAIPAPVAAEEPDGETPSDRLMVVDDDGQPTGEFVAIDPETAVGRWDPVEVPLPKYVSSPAAARNVGTIDLDGTGVWSSGRNEADSALAREADEAEAAARAAQSANEHQRASGS